MPHGRDLLQALDNAILPVDEGVFHLHKGGGVVQHVHVLLQLPAVGGLVGEDAPGHADALAVALHTICSLSMSMSWYFKEELPALMTRIFMVRIFPFLFPQKACGPAFPGGRLLMVVISPALLRTGGCFV